MTPILFSPHETQFRSNGLGMLADATSCTVEHAINGLYELELKYPMVGRLYPQIQTRSIVMAKPGPDEQPQPFRIYRATKPIRGIVTYYARHLSYDLMGIPVTPFTAANVSAAMQALRSNAAVDCPFYFSTDKTTTANMKLSAPRAIWDALGGKEGSALDVYGGEYEFDRYSVRLRSELGQDRGVQIRYGKNLSTLEQDENCDNTYTGVCPYWADADGNLVQLPEKILNALGTYDHVRILTLDLSSEFEEKPSVEQLRSRAQRYMTDNDIGVPKVSLTVSFVALAQTVEYRDRATLEQVSLGDIVTVIFPRLGVNAKSRVIQVSYDALRNRYTSIQLGSLKSKLPSTIAGNTAQGQENADKIFIESQKRKSEDGKLQSELTVQAGKIEAKVEKVGGGKSFSWELLEDSWTLKSRGIDVLKVTETLAKFSGTIEAADGKVGGWDIKTNYLSYRGQTWMGNVENGLYAGDQGIQVGTKFRVDMYGNLDAASGHFSGTVQAGKIDYGGDAGYFSGGGLSDRSVSGVKVGGSTLTTYNTNNGINTSLSHADWAYSVLNGWTQIERITSEFVYVNDGCYVGSLSLGGTEIRKESATVKNSAGENVTIYYLGWA